VTNRLTRDTVAANAAAMSVACSVVDMSSLLTATFGCVRSRKQQSPNSVLLPEAHLSEVEDVETHSSPLLRESLVGHGPTDHAHAVLNIPCQWPKPSGSASRFPEDEAWDSLGSPPHAGGGQGTREMHSSCAQKRNTSTDRRGLLLRAAWLIVRTLQMPTTRAPWHDAQRIAATSR
jgi:hypothetical protein